MNDRIGEAIGGIVLGAQPTRNRVSRMGNPSTIRICRSASRVGRRTLTIAFNWSVASASSTAIPRFRASPASRPEHVTVATDTAGGAKELFVGDWINVDALFDGLPGCESA